MAESFAGITVPDGTPGELHAAAGSFESLSAELSGVSGALGGLPGAMPTWQGPASVSYAGSCAAGSGGADAACRSVATAGQATRRYAQELEDAQREARRAIADARDATNRIDQAKREIARARSDQATASQRADQAAHVLAVSSAHGLPSPGAQADLTAAGQAGEDAAGRERQASRELERAQEDLRRAQQRGREAEQHAREAAQTAAGGFQGGGPTVGPVGPPGAPVTSPTGNSLAYDALVAPWDLSNPSNGVGFLVGGGIGGPQSYAQFRSKYTRVSGYWGRTSAAGDRSWVDPYWRRLPRGADAPTDRLGNSWSAGPTAERWAGGAKWLGRAGVVSGYALGGLDQWRSDASNPNLSTADRVGRAGGAGVYTGTAAAAGGWAGAEAGGLAGAELGTLVGGPMGTAVGGALGALIGGLGGGAIAGGIANHFTDVKDAFVSAGSDVANTVSDGLDEAGKVLDDLNPF